MASVQAIPDFEVLKEPRGLLRFSVTSFSWLNYREISPRAVQWLFAVLAFSTACHYSTVLTLKPTCTAKGSDQTPPDQITLEIFYPFRLLVLSIPAQETTGIEVLILLGWTLTDRPGNIARCVDWRMSKKTGEVCTTSSSLATSPLMQSFSCSLASLPGFIVSSGQANSWHGYLEECNNIIDCSYAQPSVWLCTCSSTISTLTSRKTIPRWKMVQPFYIFRAQSPPGWFRAHCLVGNVLVGGLGGLGQWLERSLTFVKLLLVDFKWYPPLLAYSSFYNTFTDRIPIYQQVWKTSARDFQKILCFVWAKR